eukprot:scaffold244_cov372-Pavlova_lutheri.AAC.13
MVLIVPFWTLTADDELDDPYRGVTGLFNEQVLLKASDPRALLTPSASGHRRSTQGVVSLPSIRVCPTSPSWVQVYTTAFLILQRSRVEQLKVPTPPAPIVP